MSERRSCIVCGKTDNLKQCGFCKTAVYCSREHQSRDWSTHKPVCIKLRETPKQADNSDVGDGSQSGASVTTRECTEARSDPNVSSNGDVGNKTESYENSYDRDKEEKDNAARSDSNNRVVSFDDKPFKQIKFPTLESSEPADIGKFAADELKMNGHCVIEKVFEDRIIDEALSDIKRCETKGLFQQGKLAGGRTSGVDSEKTVRSSIRTDQIMWVEGDEDSIPGIRSVVEKMDGIVQSFNEFLRGTYHFKQRTKAMVACYPGNGTFYRRHVDNPNKDGRAVTCILYLNKAWDPLEDGGVLRIFPMDLSKDGGYVDVAPVANRLLFFWSDRRNPHEVQPAHKSRYAITVWYFDEEERRKACLDHHNTEMTKIRGNLALMELESHKKEAERLTKELDDTVTGVISSLSEEELKALAAVVADHPDPRAVLTSLGVTPVIHERLLEKLKSVSVP